MHCNQLLFSLIFDFELSFSDRYLTLFRNKYILNIKITHIFVEKGHKVKKKETEMRASMRYT